MEFNMATDRGRRGDESGVFGLSLCDRRQEDFKDVDERDLGPKTEETELRLGLPGDCLERERHLSESRPSDSVSKHQKNINCVGAKRAFWDTIEGFSSRERNSLASNKSGCLPPRSSKTQTPSFEPNPAVRKMPSSVVTDVRKENTSELQRVVVGWPPLRSSFRKNFAASSSSKPPVDKEKQVSVDSMNGNIRPAENVKKGLFVKINMDGVSIGRKIDLHAYDSYQKLATGVDVLFRGLLAAQNATDGDLPGSREEKPITGLLDGSGEYTLVYEDNEGDRMLVGDVPWGMFASSVKRLRVLKSCDLSALLVPPNVKLGDNSNPSTAK